MSKKLWIGLFLLAVAVLISGLFLGPTTLHLGSVFHSQSPDNLIFWHVRLPRILTAFLVGASLGLAGAAFQAVLQNPLADPFVLGVSAGAGLGAVIVILLGLSGVLMIPLGAFAGALLTTWAVFALVIASGRTNIIHYILAGMIVNAFVSSLTMLLIFFSNERLRSVLFWLMGDFSLANWTMLKVLAMFILPISFLLICTGYTLNVMSLGDTLASTMGVSVTWMRRLVFVLASVLTGMAVAGAGIIGFVGLVVPHFLRLILKDDFRVLMPASFLAGGILLVVTDTVARSLLISTELPVGVLTSFLGAPFFLWLMFRTTRKSV